MGHIPDTGNQRSCTAKIKINIIPRKNDGIDIPTKTADVIALSIKLYCRDAEITPAKIPKNAQKIKDVPARTSVALNLSKTSSKTSRLSAKLLPKSPCSIFPNQMKYLCTRGLSKPKSLFSFSTFSGVA